MVKPAPAPVHGGDIITAAARWGLEPGDLLDFSANINPFGPPVGAVAAARAALTGVQHYPEPYARSLRAMLAHRHGLPDGAVLVGNGAAEVLHLVIRQAAGRRAAVPAPGFAEYGRAALAVSAEVLPYGERPPQLRAQDLLVICNPNNPTGRLLPPERIIQIAAETEATVLVDEAFIDLTDEGEAGSAIRAAAEQPNLVVVRSLTKFYAMPGLRVGYAVSHPARIGQLDALRDPWSVSPVARAAAIAALSDTAYAERVRAWVRAERPFLAAALAGIPGFTVTPPSANFMLVQASEPAWAIQERLGSQGIIIRDCRSFEGLTERHLRVAVRSREDNLRLLEALRA